MHLRFTCLKQKLKDFGAAVKLLKEQLDKWDVVSNMQLSVQCVDVPSTKPASILPVPSSVTTASDQRAYHAAIVCRNCKDNLTSVIVQRSAAVIV